MSYLKAFPYVRIPPCLTGGINFEVAVSKVPDSNADSELTEIPGKNEMERTVLLSEVERKIEQLLKFPNLPLTIKSKLIDSSFEWATAPSITKFIGRS